MKTVVVVDYDPTWPAVFEQLRARVLSAIGDIAISVEHVGSTSVPGLAGKPVIDICVVIPTPYEVELTIKRLATVGYQHRGDLGIPGREAFKQPDGLPKHHLYVCPRDNLALRNLLAVRDYLKVHPQTASEYGDLKRRLASQFTHDIDSYIEGKTDLVLRILREAGLNRDQLEAIEVLNRKQDGSNTLGSDLGVVREG